MKNIIRFIFVIVIVCYSYDKDANLMQNLFNGKYTQNRPLTLPMLFIYLFLTDYHKFVIVGSVAYSIVPYIYNELNNEYFHEHGNATQRNPFVEWNNLEPSLGDMIQFRRNFLFFFDFTHWGIFDGDGGIIHYVVDRHRIGQVRLETLNDVAYQGLSSYSEPQTYLHDFLTLFSNGGFSLVRVNNMETFGHSQLLKRRRPEDIYQSALAELLRYHKHIENPVFDVDLLHYNKLKQNCEHFVTKCSFGEPFSFQTDTMYTYWTKQAVNDFKTFVLIFEICSTSIMRVTLKMLLNKIFTDKQLEKILKNISSALTFLDDAIHENVSNFLMERIWVFAFLFILLKMKRVFINKLNEAKRIYRIRQRNASRPAVM